MDSDEATSSKDAVYEVDRVATWVKKHDFQRIAVQFPEELLADAPSMVSRLQRELTGRKVFALGDSTYGSSSVDEVGAQHYGADCLVHIGPSDQQHTGAMPVLFVFGRNVLKEATLLQSLENLVSELVDHFGGESPCSLVLLCEVELHHALARSLTLLHQNFHRRCEIFVATPHHEARGTIGDDLRTPLFRTWRDCRFGLASLGTSWWASLGPLTRAVASKPEPLRICGRRVLHAENGSVGQPNVLEHTTRWPTKCGILYLGSAESALERRVVLRHGHGHPCWRLEPHGDGTVERISSDKLLLQRYRFVEIVRSAGVIGLLLCTSGAQHGNAVADRLEIILRRAGRRVYRFIVGRLTPEKLGNFPEVECFVSLASPEHFPFNTKDFQQHVVSPYEVEVALGVREWTGDYITDLDEMLASPLPSGPPDDSTLAVQTLGASARVRHFHADCGNSLGASQTDAISTPAVPGAGFSADGPALVTEGLHGIAGKYKSEFAN